MSPRVYLDWNATTPLCAPAKAAMGEAMELMGNPSSVHAEGRAARRILDTARDHIADLCGAGAGDVVFTSSATESLNWVIRGGMWDAVFYGATEHDAARAPADETQGVEIPVDSQGVLRPDALERALAETPGERRLVCLQAVNNETGVLQPIEDAIKIAHDADALIAIDAVQAAGRLPFDFRGSNADFAAVSAHKLQGPKGVGALLIRDDLTIAPLISGGGQEMRRRSGTENVIGVAGFGAACAAANLAAWAAIAALRSPIEDVLAAAEAHIFSQAAGRAPNVTCFAIPGWEAAAQLMQLDLKGVAVSAGSACTSGKVSPSHVITAMGFDAATARSAVRVSLGPETSSADIAHFIEIWTGLHARWRIRAA